jgi:hypothetical protein
MDQEQFHGKGIERRTFMGSAAGTLVAALPATQIVGGNAAMAQRRPARARGRVDISRMTIVNSLGDLDDSYGPRPPELDRDPRTMISPGAIRAGLESGLTAVNITLDAENFESCIARSGVTTLSSATTPRRFRRSGRRRTFAMPRRAKGSA